MPIGMLPSVVPSMTESVSRWRTATKCLQATQMKCELHLHGLTSSKSVQSTQTPQPSVQALAMATTKQVREMY